MKLGYLLPRDILDRWLTRVQRWELRRFCQDDRRDAQASPLGSEGLKTSNPNPEISLLKLRGLGGQRACQDAQGQWLIRMGIFKAAFPRSMDRVLTDTIHDSVVDRAQRSIDLRSQISGIKTSLPVESHHFGRRRSILPPRNITVTTSDEEAGVA